MSATLKYFDLTIPAPRRLQMMRDAFANHAAKYPRCHGHMKPKSWRDIRGTTHGGVSAYVCALSQGFNGEGRSRRAIWYAHSGEQFRDEKFCDAVADAGIRHAGWYCDTDSHETARGIVARLPHGRFIAGYHLSMNGERVYFGDVFDDETDAARMADEHARVIGEQEQEYSRRYEEAQDLENDIDNAILRLLECLALRNDKRFAALREEARELVETIRDKRNELKTDYAGVL